MSIAAFGLLIVAVSLMPRGRWGWPPTGDEVDVELQPHGQAQALDPEPDEPPASGFTECQWEHILSRGHSAGATTHPDFGLRPGRCSECDQLVLGHRDQVPAPRRNRAAVAGEASGPDHLTRAWIEGDQLATESHVDDAVDNGRRAGKSAAALESPEDCARGQVDPLDLRKKVSTQTLRHADPAPECRNFRRE